MHARSGLPACLRHDHWSAGGRSKDRRSFASPSRAAGAASEQQAGEWAYGENAVVGTLTCPNCGLTIRAEEKSPGRIGFQYPDSSHLICNSKARRAVDERPEALSCPDLNKPYMQYLNMLLASFAPGQKTGSESH